MSISKDNKVEASRKEEKKKPEIVYSATFGPGKKEKNKTADNKRQRWGI